MRIDTPTKRLKLAIRREPYWHKIQRGGYLGFRRTADGGTWIARRRDEQGKHHYRALGLALVAPESAFDAASRAAGAWFKETEAGVVRRSTVKHAAGRYVASRRIEKGEANANDSEGRILRCINPTLGSRPLDRLTTADIEEWRNGLVPPGLDDEQTRKAKDSANRNLATLKALLNHAWRTGLVGSKDAWAKVEKFKGIGEARKVFLTPEQRKRLFEQCKGGFRDLIEAGFLTGARYGELRALLVSDYDKARRVLSIREGKTGPRSVPLSDAAAKLFDRLRKNKLPGAALLTRDDGQPWQHSDQDKLMREAVKKARLPNGTVYYTLRHTFIANALTGGIDILTVAKLSGTSVAMIEQHYGKLLHADAREKLNKIAFA
jgi:integrase